MTDRAEQPTVVRLVSAIKMEWTASTLAAYLEDVDLLFSFARAIAAELDNQGEPLTTADWAELELSVPELRRVSSQRRRRGSSAPIASLSVGSIDLAILVGPAMAASVVALLRSVLVKGPSVIEEWATLLTKIKLKNAENAAKIRDIADKVAETKELEWTERRLLQNVARDPNLELLTRLEQEVDRAVGELKERTPDLELFVEGDL